MSDDELQELMQKVKACTIPRFIGPNEKYADRVQILLLAEILTELRKLRTEAQR